MVTSTIIASYPHKHDIEYPVVSTLYKQQARAHHERCPSDYVTSCDSPREAFCPPLPFRCPLPATSCPLTAARCPP
ncbi:unnamed protein product [Colias eurytheme]|nr:unnamed protein product [Colias eurytheme]